MKKALFLFVALFMLTGFVKSQTILYQDNLDSYTLNSFLAVNNPTWWTTWSNAPGGNEDLQILNTFSHSSSMSGSADLVSAATDAVLKLGDRTTGVYELKWWMYIQTGKCGYYNIQHMQVPGTEWAFEIYFRTNGDIQLLAGSSTPITGTYPKDTWFEVKQIINLDGDNITLFINGVSIHTWPFHYQASLTTGTNQLGGVDFFAGEFSGSGESPAFFIDDISFIQNPVGINEIENDEFMVYPNPVNDKLNILTNENISNISVNDINGKTVLTGNSKSIDVSALSNGVYFVKIETAKGITNSKFIKY